MYVRDSGQGWTGRMRWMTIENLHMKGLSLFDYVFANVKVGVCHFFDVSS